MAAPYCEQDYPNDATHHPPHVWPVEGWQYQEGKEPRRVWLLYVCDEHLAKTITDMYTQSITVSRSSLKNEGSLGPHVDFVQVRSAINEM